MLVDSKVQKICRDCEGLGASPWTVAELSDSLRPFSGEPLQKLKSRAVEALRTLDPQVAAAYESYSRLQVRRSDQTLDFFDKDKITDSLVRETHLPRGVSEKIARELEQELKSLNVKTASSILIRELVNTKLVQYGFEEAKLQYTRVGLPVFDVHSLLAQDLEPKKVKQFISSSVLTQYALLKVLPREAADAHLSGALFISTLPEFSLKVYSVSSLSKGFDCSSFSSHAVNVCADSGQCGNASFDANVVNVLDDFPQGLRGDFKIGFSAASAKKVAKRAFSSKFSGRVFAYPQEFLPGPEELLFNEPRELVVLERVGVNLEKLLRDSKQNKSVFLKGLEHALALAEAVVEAKLEALHNSKLSDLGVRLERLPSVASLYGLEGVAVGLSSEELSHPDSLGEALEVLEKANASLSRQWLFCSSLQGSSVESVRFSKAGDSGEQKPLQASRASELAFFNALQKKLTAGFALQASSEDELLELAQRGFQARVS